MDIISPYLNTETLADQHPVLTRHPPLREKTKRPQLSCNPCRQRKVKCDRIQPCTACSMHQVADQCQYDLSEAERQPILQAEALKEKDKAIARLRNEVEILRGHPIKPEPLDDVQSMRSAHKIRLPPKAPLKPSSLSQRRLHSGVVADSIYFGSPGMTSVIDEFADLSVERKGANLTHAIPRGTDIFAFQLTTSHPFPTLWSAKEETSGLVTLLPSKEDIHFYLNCFQRRAQSCSFPHVPEECTEREVQRFLDNVEQNAALHPYMLALLFATLAQGLQDGVYDRNGGKWVAGSVEAETKKGDIYIAAAFQALRVASFMNRPTLLSIEALVMMGSYLTNCGKLLDASAIFGLTVRLAQSIGLHRDPNQLNPPPPLREINMRKNLWWWMLHMDQHYSMLLGRPLAISSIGDCPAPEPTVPDPIVQSLSNYISQFTVLGRQILSAGCLSNDQIDNFTDQLLSLKQSLPDVIRFDETWLNHEKKLPGWPLDAQAGVLHAKIHNCLILLNQQRMENPGHPSTNDSTELPDTPLTASNGYYPRGRARVLDSCRALLTAFEYFQTRLPAAMICWAMGQMAFNAAMILMLSMLETREDTDLRVIQHTYTAFIDMNKLGIHKLAGAAVERLGSLMKDLHSEETIKEKVMGQQGMILLENPGLQGLAPDGFSPLNFQMAGGALVYDRPHKRRNTIGGELTVAAKSALAQRRRAHRNPYPGRDVRPRIPSKKPGVRNPRSPIHHPPSGRLSPKRPKQEPNSNNSTGDFPNLPAEPPSYDFVSPTQSEPSTQPFFSQAEHVFQPFQPTDFDHPGSSPQQLAFESIQNSQPGSFSQQQRQHPFAPQNTPTDANMQSLTYNSQMISSGLLDETNFQPTQEQQQQLMDFNLETQGYLQNPQYGNAHYDLTQIPVSYPTQF